MLILLISLIILVTAVAIFSFVLCVKIANRKRKTSPIYNITVYAMDGKLLRRYTGVSYVDDSNSIIVWHKDEKIVFCGDYFYEVYKKEVLPGEKPWEKLWDKMGEKLWKKRCGGSASL